MFIDHLGRSLSHSHQMEDITADYPELNFDYIGIREKNMTINLIALVHADNLSEQGITATIHTFYNYIAGFKKDLLFNKIYKPNGVICFIFENKKCAYRLRKTIPKQSLIDQPTRINYNPPLGVYPGLDAIDKLLRTYSDTDARREIHKDLRFYTNLDTLVTQTVELISNGDIRRALVRVKNSIQVNTENYHIAVMLLSNFNRIGKEEPEKPIEMNVIRNDITNRTLDFVKRLTQTDLKTH